MTKAEAKTRLKEIRRTITQLKEELPHDKAHLKVTLAPYYAHARLIRQKKQRIQELKDEAIQLRPHLHHVPTSITQTADVLGDQPRCHLCHRRIRKHYMEKRLEREHVIYCLACYGIKRKTDYQPGFKFRNREGGL